jgi:hypothetical protein
MRRISWRLGTYSRRSLSLLAESISPRAVAHGLSPRHLLGVEGLSLPEE